MGSETFKFSARLEQVEGGGPLYVAIPAAVSKTIGRRGNVAVVAVVNGRVEVRASITPTGGGRHRLRLNADARDTAGAVLGRRVAVELRVDESPSAVPLPADLVRALREGDVLGSFRSFPPGKQSHIVLWIEKAAREKTRAKRVTQSVEFALEAKERRADRAAKKGAAEST